MAVSLLRHPSWHLSRKSYASDLLEFFVSEPRYLYGKEFISYNVHNLLHIARDSFNIGPIDKFSASPFEIFLQKLKNSLRSCARPLAQVVRRFSEIEASASQGNRSNSFFAHAKGISSGPHPREFVPKRQFKCAFFKTNFLSTAPPNNVVYHANSEIAKIANIAEDNDGNFYIIVRNFTKRGAFYHYPASSRYINVFKIRNTDNKIYVCPFEGIAYKVYAMPLRNHGGHFRGRRQWLAVFPIYLEPII